jgi:hypothetical protein
MHENNGATKKSLQEKAETSETPYNSLAYYEKLKFWEIKEIQ